VPSDCTFCAIVAGDVPAHVVVETDDVLGFLDHRPVFKGHTLVLPREHLETLADLPDYLLVPLFSVVQRLSAVMPEALDAHGTWVPINNVISQSVPHLHVHVVPRRRKDGLKGFFWPRQKYAGDDEMAEYAGRLRRAYEA
jgi:histidine triad (HIT) family protein